MISELSQKANCESEHRQWEMRITLVDKSLRENYVYMCADSPEKKRRKTFLHFNEVLLGCVYLRSRPDMYSTYCILEQLKGRANQFFYFCTDECHATLRRQAKCIGRQGRLIPNFLAKSLLI